MNIHNLNKYNALVPEVGVEPTQGINLHLILSQADMPNSRIPAKMALIPTTPHLIVY